MKHFNKSGMIQENFIIEILLGEHHNNLPNKLHFSSSNPSTTIIINLLGH